MEENLRLGLFARPSRGGAEEAVAWVSDLFRSSASSPTRLRATSPAASSSRSRSHGPWSPADCPLLDEPTLGLTSSVVASLFKTLAEIRSRHVTILLVEQRAQLSWPSRTRRTHAQR